MKNLLIAIVAVCTTLAASGGHAADVLRETRAVTGFSRIEVDGQADITLRQGATEGLALEATAQSLKQIRTEVRNRTLRISLVDQSHWWQWMTGGSATRTPRITIDLIQLERIEASGAVNIVADSLKANELRLDFAGACKLKIGDLQATKLRLDGAGAIKAEIAGKVTEQSVDLSGAGSYQALDLISDTIALQVSGAGKAIVNAKTLLKADISGAGLVEYAGSPRLEQEISGIGKIRRR
ncbi:MAG TPA: head GIN domain-containing protein [Casimicrobiaceae bacterium]|nr:head GIN domain-containing protein [Casimicrobiaceae bacterium]